MFAHRDGGQHPGDIQCHPPESTEGVTTDCEAIFETYHARAFFSIQTCTVESQGGGDARVTLGPIGGSSSFLEKWAPWSRGLGFRKNILSAHLRSSRERLRRCRITEIFLLRRYPNLALYHVQESQTSENRFRKATSRALVKFQALPGWRLLRNAARK